MWDPGDFAGYMKAKQTNVGQISNDTFSSDITAYASNPRYTSFLEIGTWNGLGSTKAFVTGLRQREDDYVFYSLECNKDKSADAAKLYEGNDKLHILNEVLWNEEPADFYTIFPECLTDDTFKSWHRTDMINIKSCNIFLERPNLPKVFDVVLLDGGEFTTYHEFQLIKNRCKILMLDDINTEKCTKIMKEIYLDPFWKILKRSRMRNGYLIAERLIQTL